MCIMKRALLNNFSFFCLLSLIMCTNCFLTSRNNVCTSFSSVNRYISKPKEDKILASWINTRNSGKVSDWTRGFIQKQLLQSQNTNNNDNNIEEKYPSIDNVNVVILAGGVGSRMKADRPKQLLNLLGKPVLCHSIELFSKLRGVDKIIIVLDPSHREAFQHYADKDSRIEWALPGEERQDSVYNGLSATADNCSLVCIHDAARPLVTMEEVLHVIRDASEHGAAVLGVPMKATVKESEDGVFVLRTIPRSRLWEIHTPQVIKPSLLRDGFKKVKEEKLDVTDDVSIIEQLGLPVKLTQGEYTNLKITTPEDMPMAEEILSLRENNIKNGQQKKDEKQV